MFSERCNINVPVPDQCLEANIQAVEDFSIDNFTGTWYTLFRLRNTVKMDFGKASISKMDEHRMLGEFAFSV